jgi:alpha-glucoside transport system substrate-binding protein
MPLNRPKYRRFAVLAAVAALTTTGCLSSSDDGDDGSSGSGGGDSGDGSVEIFGAFTSTEQDGFEASLAPFEDSSGIDVEYQGDPNFATLIGTRVKSGDAPDIALFPQPGNLVGLADSGDITPLDDVIDVNAIEQTLIPGFLDATKGEDGQIYGAPIRMAVKSLVWVPKKPWEDAGYTTDPKSVQELESIGDELNADGIKPWCIGYEDGGATGWVGTDWIEEFMLRVNGPEVYDQWVSHEIPFSSPEVTAAFDAYQELMGENDDNVYGGASGILSTSFKTAGNNAFTDPPKCMMQRQGNFITGFWPKDVQADLAGTVDVMPFPAYEGGYDGVPVLGGGDLAAAFNGDDPDVQKVMEFITSDQFGKEWASQGGWLSPHKTFDGSTYIDDTTRAVAEVATSADVFRFDASDLMPAEVGAGSFWKGMVAWVGGEQSTEEVEQTIDDSWPSS